MVISLDNEISAMDGFRSFALMVLISGSIATAIDINVGVIMPYRGLASPVNRTTTSFHTCAGAISMAFNDAKKDGILDQSFTFRYYSKDSNDSIAAEMGEAVSLKQDNNIDVLFGPPTKSSEVYHLSSLWGIPHLSWLAVRSTKPKCDSTTKISVTTLKLDFKIDCIQRIMKLFKWKTFAVITGGKSHGLGDYQEDQLYTSLVYDYNFTLHSVISVSPEIHTATLQERLGPVKDDVIVILLMVDQEMEADVLQVAADMEMTSGDFVFILPSSDITDLSIRHKPGVKYHNKIGFMDAFRAVLVVSVYYNFSDGAEKVRDQMPNIMAGPPWNDDHAQRMKLRGDYFAPHVYDAAYLYAKALRQAVDSGQGKDNGRFMFQAITRMTHKGLTGNLVFDAKGNRIECYRIYSLNYSGYWRPVLQVQSHEENVTVLDQQFWSLKGGKVPAGGDLALDTVSGWWESDIHNYLILVLLLFFFTVATGIIGVVCIRRQKVESDVARTTWKIKFKDIIPVKDGSNPPGYDQALVSQILGKMKNANALRVATYNNNLVVVEMLAVQNIKIEGYQHNELLELQKTKHENINKFIGYCADPPNTCLVYEYSTKGSLQDVLENSAINLENMFKCSLIQDLACGMNYIHHQSCMRSHGRLKSTNCVIDSRWLLKITDYALATQRVQRVQHGDKYKSMLWTAPEQLSIPKNQRPLRGSRKGDVYSFGIILHEIMYRKGLFGGVASPKEIMNHLKKEPGFRPPLFATPAAEASLNNQTQTAYSTLFEHSKALMVSCWSVAPETRPTFSWISNKVLGMSDQRNNILDGMLQMMEKHAKNLENLVTTRKKELKREQEKSDELLLQMLPKVIMMQLKMGVKVEPETFKQVTLYFSALPAFVTISANLTPVEIVDLLNTLYTMFDEIIDSYDVYKVETISDHYMVVSGCPTKNGDQHVKEIADMALNMLQSAKSFRMQKRGIGAVEIRIGISSGPCCAGVVGLKMPRYCLFGDTVNTASRMESCGLGMQIQMSEDSYKALSKLNTNRVYYHCQKRGVVEVKGKGSMTTYWLLGKGKKNSKLIQNSASSNSAKRKAESNEINGSFTNITANV